MKKFRQIYCTPLSFLFLRQVFDLDVCEYLLYMYFLTIIDGYFDKPTFYRELGKINNYNKEILEERIGKLCEKKFIELIDISLLDSSKEEELKAREFKEDQIFIKVNKNKLIEGYNLWKVLIDNEETKLQEKNKETDNFIKISYPKSNHISLWDLETQKRNLEWNYDNDIKDINFDIMLKEDELKKLKLNKESIKEEYKQECLKIDSEITSAQKLNELYENEVQEYNKVINLRNKEINDIEEKINLMKNNSFDIPNDIKEKYKITFNKYCFLQYADIKQKIGIKTNGNKYLLMLLLFAQLTQQRKNPFWVSQSKLSEILNPDKDKINEKATIKKYLDDLKSIELIKYKYIPKYQKTLVKINKAKVLKAIDDYEAEIIYMDQPKGDYSNMRAILGFNSSQIQKEVNTPLNKRKTKSNDNSKEVIDALTAEEIVNDYGNIIYEEEFAPIIETDDFENAS